MKLIRERIREHRERTGERPTPRRDMLRPAQPACSDPALAAWALGLSPEQTELLVNWCAGTLEERQKELDSVREYLNELGMIGYGLDRENPETVSDWLTLVRQRNDAVTRCLGAWTEGFRAHLVTNGYLQEEAAAFVSLIEPWWAAEFAGSRFELPSASANVIALIGEVREQLDPDTALMVRSLVTDESGRLLELRLSIERAKLQLLSQAFGFDAKSSAASEDAYSRGRTRLLKPSLVIERRYASLQRELLGAVATLLPASQARDLEKQYLVMAYGELGNDPWDIQKSAATLREGATEPVRLETELMLEADYERRKELHLRFLRQLEDSLYERRIAGIVSDKMTEDVQSALQAWRIGSERSAKDTLAALASAVGRSSELPDLTAALERAATSMRVVQDDQAIIKAFRPAETGVVGGVP